jgi:hypothetical protein
MIVLVVDGEGRLIGIEVIGARNGLPPELLARAQRGVQSRSQWDASRGAGAEIRTRTPLRAAEFKSAASASSATPARTCMLAPPRRGSRVYAMNSSSPRTISQIDHAM